MRSHKSLIPTQETNNCFKANGMGAGRLVQSGSGPMRSSERAAGWLVSFQTQEQTESFLMTP